MALYIGTEVVYITRMAHVLGQKCMHKQCRPRLDQGLHYLAYRQYLYVILEDSRINLFEFKCSDNMAKCLNTQDQSINVFISVMVFQICDINPFLTSKFVHPYHWDESIPSFRGFWLMFCFDCIFH